MKDNNENEITEEEYQKLIQEDISSSVEFNSVLQKFIQNNCTKIKVTESEEQPIEGFLKRENVASDRLIEACQRISEVDEHYISCIDYILASSEYEEFYEMMVDYKKIFSYEFEENSELDQIINK